MGWDRADSPVVLAVVAVVAAEAATAVVEMVAMATVRDSPSSCHQALLQAALPVRVDSPLRRVVPEDRGNTKPSMSKFPHFHRFNNLVRGKRR